MARSKKVDPEAAVQAAMMLFWKQGYMGLGTRQIEEETGITRFTLQTSYGGKMQLFLAALDTYLNIFETHGCPNMSDGDLNTIASWFEARTEPETFADIACYGCLMLNSLVEFAAQDRQVNLRRERFYRMVRSGFYSALRAAQQKGTVSSKFDVDAMAEVLLSSTIGLNIVIRSAADNSAGQKSAQSIGILVRSWAVS
jgi:TetR/AcrR family transcriptional repressor of nem operon